MGVSPCHRSNFRTNFRLPTKLRPSQGNLQGTSETGGQRGGMSPPVFEGSVDLKSTKGEDYALHIITPPPQIFRPSDIPIYSFVGTFLVTWKPICMDWQKGLVWLQAICTCPQKAIVGLKKFLHRWIPCKKSLQKLSSEPRKTFSRIIATHIRTVMR